MQWIIADYFLRHHRHTHFTWTDRPVTAIVLGLIVLVSLFFFFYFLRKDADQIDPRVFYAAVLFELLSIVIGLFALFVMP